MKLGILFGSSTNEHEISVVSAASIIKNLDKSKYEIIPIYLNKKNEFFIWKENIKKIKPQKVGILPTKLEKIDHPFEYLKTFDVVFIAIHGQNGEDGTFSHILNFLNVPYIGSNPETSIITMNKILTKKILEQNNIKMAPYLALTKINGEYFINNKSIPKLEVLKKIKSSLKYPLYIKPACSGSSIGIAKVSNEEELDKGLDKSLEFGNQVLIEEEIKGREIECGLLENNNEIIASTVGEVKKLDSFYSFEEKYLNKKSKIVIPAKINEKKAKEIKKEAIKIFKILNCNLFSRCDFFLTNDNQIIFNEINTIPGFTESSMYPKLFKDIGISYKDLLDILISESLK